MEDKKWNDQDRFLKEALQRITPESPRQEVFQNVMTRVYQEKPYQVAVKQKAPLIPAWIKVVFVISLLAMLGAVFFTVEKNDAMAGFFLQLEAFSSRYMSLFVSQLFVLSSIACAVLFVVQVWFLSKKMKLAV